MKKQKKKWDQAFRLGWQRVEKNKVKFGTS